MDLTGKNIIECAQTTDHRPLKGESQEVDEIFAARLADLFIRQLALLKSVKVTKDKNRVP